MSKKKIARKPRSTKQTPAKKRTGARPEVVDAVAAALTGEPAKFEPDSEAHKLAIAARDNLDRALARTEAGARSPEQTIRLTGDGVWCGETVRDDAEIGDVIRELFRDDEADLDGHQITPFVVRSVIDDLGLLMLAAENASTCEHETARVACRLRHRLILARWLDERIAVVNDSESAVQS